MRSGPRPSGMGVPAARIAPINAIANMELRGEAILAGIQTPSVYQALFVNPARPREHRKATEDRTQNFNTRILICKRHNF